MEKGKVRFSLRYKLLILLTILPILTLSLYLVMATRLFEKDKVAYVFDSGLTVSRSVADQSRTELESLLQRVKPAIENYDFDRKQFSVTSREVFLKQSGLVELVLVTKKNGKLSKIGEVRPTGDKSVIGEQILSNRLFDQAQKNGFVLSRLGKTDQILVAQKISDDGVDMLALVVSRMPSLVKTFSSESTYKMFLINNKGEVVVGAGEQMVTQSQRLFQTVVKSPLPEGTAEVKINEGESLLISFANIGIGNLSVTSVVDKQEALKAVDVLIAKSLLFFIALIAGTVIISVFSSIKLTSTLKELYEATLKLAKGEFDVRVQRRSDDEIGGLADSFNWMAGEVSRLLLEAGEKARMESELGTVKVVQETLFPPSEADFGPLKVAGFFQPASECGGDWWSYSQVGSKIYLWLGDATGHGAPAALITAAACSAASIIESMPELTPAQAMEILNRAIYQTSKSRVMMTFFFAIVDLETNVMTYANASHEPPFLIPKKEGKVRKKDLTLLMDVSGRRLGEKPDSKYEEGRVELKDGDIVYLYTDGIIDLENPSGEKYGERRFIKTIVETGSQSGSLKDKLDALKQSFDNYREASDPVDDVTVVVCEYNSQTVKSA